jgi:hypothetical protein
MKRTAIIDLAPMPLILEHNLQQVIQKGIIESYIYNDIAGLLEHNAPELVEKEVNRDDFISTYGKFVNNIIVEIMDGEENVSWRENIRKRLTEHAVKAFVKVRKFIFPKEEVKKEVAVEKDPLKGLNKNFLDFAQESLLPYLHIVIQKMNVIKNLYSGQSAEMGRVVNPKIRDLLKTIIKQSSNVDVGEGYNRELDYIINTML